MVKRWAFIYCSPGYNKEENTVVMNNGQTKIFLIGVDVTERDQAIEIAKDLYEQENIEMIELCGGFGPYYASKIKEATNYKIPVGMVMYGPEDRGPMLNITRGQTPENQ